MDFIADRNDLAMAVAAVAPGLPARPVNPAHLGVLVGALGEVAQVTAADGASVLNCVFDAETSENGQFVFPRIFPEVAKSLPGERVRIQVEGLTGTVTSGKTTFTFPVIPGGNYPFSLLDVPVIGEVDGPEFRMALRKVLPAVSRDNPLPALTAVMLYLDIGKLMLAATDKYALAVAECDFTSHSEGLEFADPGDRQVLLPGRMAEKIARMDGAVMSLGLDKNRIQVRSGGLTLTCPQVDGKYPQWNMILSLGDQWTQLPDGLADSVKRASLTLGDKEAVVLDFGDELTVRSEGSKGGFAESFPVDYNGEHTIVRVSPSMLSDALAWCGEVCVEQGRPLVFRGHGTRYMIQVRRENAQA